MARKPSKAALIRQGRRRPHLQPRTKSKARRPRPGWRLLGASLAVFALVLGGGLLWPLSELPVPVSRPAAGEDPGVQVVRVIDGDTFELADGERVRILNIDAAEMPPRSRCDAERDLALAAKARLSELVRKGAVITLIRQGRDRDQYDRQLRRVRVDEQDVGDLLVREGLAKPWRGRRAAWCQES